MTDKEKVESLLEVIEEICRDVREKYVQDDVCGLCEYDCDYGLDGYANECPGFERDDCFRLREDFLDKYETKRMSVKDRYFIRQYGMTRAAMLRIIENAKSTINWIVGDIEGQLYSVGVADEIRGEYEISDDEPLFKYAKDDRAVFQNIISNGTRYGGSTSAQEALNEIEEIRE